MVQYGRVWYSMVEYGRVWYSMVEYGTVWYSMVEYGRVWYGMVQYGRVWYGMVEYGIRLPYYSTTHLSLTTIGEGQGSLSIHTVQVCQVHLHKNNLHELNVLRERSYISDLCVNSCRQFSR